MWDLRVRSFDALYLLSDIYNNINQVLNEKIKENYVDESNL